MWLLSSPAVHLFDGLYSAAFIHSPVCIVHTGTAAGPCWPSEPDLVPGQLQTETPAPGPLPPFGPPLPWRCNQIYPSPDLSQSPSLLHREAPLCLAGPDLYLIPSQCPERTTATQKPLLLLFITLACRQGRREREIRMKNVKDET